MKSVSEITFLLEKLFSKQIYVSKIVSETIFCFEKRFQNVFSFRETLRKRFSPTAHVLLTNHSILFMCTNRSVKSWPILQCTCNNEASGIVHNLFCRRLNLKSVILKPPQKVSIAFEKSSITQWVLVVGFLLVSYLANFNKLANSFHLSETITSTHKQLIDTSVYLCTCALW